MTTKTERPKPTPYGCAPGYVGPDPIRLMRSDARGLYRRPSIDLRTGEIIRDAAGAVTYDENIQSCRHHLSRIAAGWELVRVTEIDSPTLAESA